MPATPAEIARRALADHLSSLPAGELLSRYAKRRDPEAFAGLVQQFGPLVLGVCRRVLGPVTDVDDAFQAVFLALARQADSFRDARALPAWLHRVALRTARKALARRLSEPTADSDEPEPVDPDDPFPNPAWKDIRRVLDEELDALPAEFRGPVVLCWLDGLTQDEAAGRLGASLNTLKRRLRAGRELLRARLTRRGLAPALVAAAVFDPAGLRAVVPDALAALTIEHALPAAAVPIGVNSLAVFVAVTSTTRTYARVGLALVLVAGAGVAGVMRPAAPPVVEAPPPTPTPVVEVPTFRPPALPRGVIAQIGSAPFRVPHPLVTSTMTRDGKLVAVAGADWVRVYDAATWTERHAFRVGPGRLSPETGDGTQLVFSPDGTRLCCLPRRLTSGGEKEPSAWAGNTVWVWNVPAGTLAYQVARADLPERSDPIVGFTSANDLVIGRAAGPDGKPGGIAIVWDDRRAPDPVLDDFADAQLVTVSPCGTQCLLWRGSIGERLQVHRLTGSNLNPHREFNGDAWGVPGGAAFSPDGKWLATVVYDWAPNEDRQKVIRAGVLDPSKIVAVEVLDVTKYTGSDRNSSHRSTRFNYNREPDMRDPRVDRRPVLEYGADGQTLALFISDRTFGNPSEPRFRWPRQVWDTETGGTIQYPKEWRTVGFHRRGATVLVPGSDGFVEVAESVRRIPDVYEERKTLGRYRSLNTSVDLTEDGKILAVVAKNGGTELWDATTGQFIRTVPEGQRASDPELIRCFLRVGLGPPVYVTDSEGVVQTRRLAPVVLSRDDRLVAGRLVSNYPMSADPTGKNGIVIASRAGAVLHHLPDRPPGNGTAVAFSSDGHRLAVEYEGFEGGVFHREVELIDTASGKVVNRFAIRPKDVSAQIVASTKADAVQRVCGLSADGSRVLVTGYGRFAVVWDAAAGKPLALLEHAAEVLRGWYTPEGHVVTTVSNFGYRWDVNAVIAAQKP